MREIASRIRRVQHVIRDALARRAFQAANCADAARREAVTDFASRAMAAPVVDRLALLQRYLGRLNRNTNDGFSVFSAAPRLRPPAADRRATTCPMGHAALD
jgi:hypothetical protein